MYLLISKPLSMRPINKNHTFSLLFFFLLGTSPVFAQHNGNPPAESGGQYPAGRNDAGHPCITPEQYQVIEKRIADNIKLLKPGNAPQKRTTSSTLFSWPLMPAAGLTDCSYYYIGNYVDQDPTSGIKDYNCGAVTYDGHQGTDICSAPYPFYKMDNNLLNVVAAAPGTIIDKQDGNFDKNCAMGSATANYIILQHADGSCALYWHMKKFSLTSKIIGQTVALGEFLGVVGSSGSSTAPHLHFEVWNGTTVSTLNDPYTGTCNTLNPATWWVSQKPYTEPAVIKAQINNIPPILPGCDTTETPNEDSCFTAGGSARFYMFIRNETPGLTANERIVNPGGTTFSSWVHNSVTSYQASYWFFIRTLPTTPGIYTYEVVYNGITCSKNFKINCAALGTSAVNGSGQIEAYPNPASQTLNVAMEGVDDGNYRLMLTNVVGQTVLKDQATVYNNTGQKSLAISSLPNGIYFLSVESDKMRVVKKIVKQD